MPAKMTLDRLSMAAEVLPDLSPTAREILLAFVKKHEGLRLEPYIDSAGHWTVGYGHLIPEGLTQLYFPSISHGAALHLLFLDLQKARAGAKAAMGPTWDSLPDLQKAACIELTFNLGAAGFRKFRVFRHALIARDWPKARRASERFYRAPSGDWVPLTRRNEAFIHTFFPETQDDALQLEAPVKERERRVPQKETEEAVQSVGQQPQPAQAAPRAGNRDEAGVRPVAKGGLNVFKNLLRAIFGGLAKATEDGDLTRDEVEVVLRETAFEAAWNPIRRQIVDLSERLSPADATILGEELVEIGEDIADNAGNR